MELLLNGFTLLDLLHWILLGVPIVMLNNRHRRF